MNILELAQRARDELEYDNIIERNGLSDGLSNNAEARVAYMLRNHSDALGCLVTDSGSFLIYKKAVIVRHLRRNDRRAQDWPGLVRQLNRDEVTMGNLDRFAEHIIKILFDDDMRTKSGLRIKKKYVQVRKKLKELLRRDIWEHYYSTPRYIAEHIVYAVYGDKIWRKNYAGITVMRSCYSKKWSAVEAALRTQ